MGYCGAYCPGFHRLGGQGYFGMGRGRRGGFGFGFRGAYPVGYQADDLKSYQRYLEEELNYVKEQLKQEEYPLTRQGNPPLSPHRGKQ
jgi:hypothetical protein